jgi:hypothetical protein
MAGTKISALSVINSLANDTVFPVVDSTNNFKANSVIIKAYVLSGNVTADKFVATNNGNGTNFKVGDDIWIGDVNVANAMRVAGQQDGTQGYIIFGNVDNNNYIGRSGSGAIAVSGAFTSTGNLTVSANLIAGGSAGSSGQYLQSTGTGVQWATGYGNTQVAAYLVANPPAGTYSNTNVTAYLAASTVSVGLFQGKQISETFVATTPTPSANIANFDCSGGQIFNVNTASISNNFTANLQNLNLANGYVTTVSLILNQGTTPYIPTNVTVDGNSISTFTWQGGSTPSGNANKKDVVAFNILRTGAGATAYTVLSQLISF